MIQHIKEVRVQKDNTSMVENGTLVIREIHVLGNSGMVMGRGLVKRSESKLR